MALCTAQQIVGPIFCLAFKLLQEKLNKIGP
jgi:hypothetical protein